MLAEQLKIIQASAVSFYLKAKNFHWNVEGKNFREYHGLFDEIADEVFDNTVDRAAEFVRVLNQYAPGSLLRMRELSIIEDQTKVPRAELMIQELYADNEKMSAMLKEAFTIAEEANEQGIANFIAERIDAHGKHGWFLRSVLKTERE
jgi:starvation-inducible DNA-binding protein